MILSLLLSIATGVLWKRSHHTWDTLYLPHPAYGAGIRSAKGEIVVNVKLQDVCHLPLQTGYQSTEPNIILYGSSSGSLVWEASDEPMGVGLWFDHREEKAFRWRVVDYPWIDRRDPVESNDHNRDGQFVVYGDGTAPQN